MSDYSNYPKFRHHQSGAVIRHFTFISKIKLKLMPKNKPNLKVEIIEEDDVLTDEENVTQVTKWITLDDFDGSYFLSPLQNILVYKEKLL